MLSIIKLRLLRLKDDVMVFILMTAMALGFTAIFGFSFNSYRPTVLLVDEDQSYYSEKLINELKENIEFNFVITDLLAASKDVQEGNVSVALLIKDDFDKSIRNNEKVSLGIIKLKDDLVVFTLQELVSTITLKMSSGARIADVTAKFIKSTNSQANIQAIKELTYNNVMDSWKYKNPIKSISKVAQSGAKSGYDGLKHSMIGFTVFFSTYTMVFSIGTILSDKQYKTWERMLVSPLTKKAILGGTMTVSYLIGAVQIGVLILCGKFLFKVDWGNSLAGVLMVAGAFVFSITSLGLMLSGFIKTQAQLGSLAPIVLTSTSMLGGCMWPLEIVNNKVLLFLAELTPQKWAIQGIESIASKGMGFNVAIIPTVVLLAMGTIYFTIGVKILNKQV